MVRISLIIIFVFLLAWSVFLEALYSMRCDRNMRQLSRIIFHYYLSHNETYPSTWEELFGDNASNSKSNPDRYLMVCPWKHKWARFGRRFPSKGPVLSTSSELRYGDNLVVAFCDHGRKVRLAISGAGMRTIKKGRWGAVLENWIELQSPLEIGNAIDGHSD